MAETTDFDGDDRRGQQRLPVNGRLYATAQRSGLIADISPAGLALHYIDRKRWPATSPDTLTICSDANEFSLAGIPYSVTSDQPVNCQKDPALVVRRMGISFGTLSPEQREQLDYLLQNLT